MIKIKINDISLILMIYWVLLFIFIICVYFLYENCNQFEVYTYQGEESGPTILIVGGTHGNEPAGSDVIHKLKTGIENGSVNIVKGTLHLIPDVNYCGLVAGIRYNPGNILNPDINRAYPSTPGERSQSYISQKVMDIANTSDFILDLHEAYDFYHNPDTDSIGQTISPNPTVLSEKISQIMEKSVNDNISRDYHKFHINKYNDGKIIKGTLSEYCKCINKHYILLETAGQNDIQPLAVRIDQMKTMIDVLLKELEVVK